MKKFAITFLPLLVISVTAWATVPNQPPAKYTQYYYGQGRIILLQSGDESNEETLLLRVVDPTKNSLVEIACTRDPGKASSLSPTYMSINGNKATLSDQADGSQNGKLTGTGDLFGPAWNWNYLKFSMRYNFSSEPGFYVLIKDVNFVVADMLIARKQIFAASGSPIELWDAELKSISSGDFQRHATDMDCPTFPQL